MSAKVIFNRKIFVLLFLSVVLFAVSCHKIPQKPSQDVYAPIVIYPIVPPISTPVKAITQVPIELPVRLVIPSLNIDANVEHLGIDAKGAMETTKGPDDVAWYKFGPRPGEIGSAVLAGHYGWINSLPAVFDKLNKLKIGDKLSVTDGKGNNIFFVVTELRSYGKYDDATNVFVSSDKKSHLNLITCEGVWDKILNSYSKRLVVFAIKE